MERSLQSRKRQLVKDAIYEAAIDLFTRKGFDETTVEELAEAAGISRRSFFRYFETKDDLLALNTVNCGKVLCEAVASSAADVGPFEVVSESVSAGVKFTEGQQFTRQIIEITQRSTSARQAQMSRLMEVHDRLSLAYSAQMGIPTRDFLRPFLLAGMTQLIVNAATGSWFMGEYKDPSSAAKEAFLELARVFGDETALLPVLEAATAGKASVSNGHRNQRSTRTKR
ncbi:MAG TPA: TetR family transcriptional regulator [Terracidiphilus sp.]|nr:TetR family transcriptional regulator [Terracidiphilus sp.]